MYSMYSVPFGRPIAHGDGPIILAEKQSSRTTSSSGKVKLVHVLSAIATEASVSVDAFKSNNRDKKRVMALREDESFTFRVVYFEMSFMCLSLPPPRLLNRRFRQV